MKKPTTEETCSPGGIPYTLRRSSRRSLEMEFTPELTLLVRAPLRCSRREIDRFVDGHADWITAHRPVAERRQARIAAREVSPEEEKRLRALAKTVLPERVAYYAAILGVAPTGISITGARKRFGSCSGKDRLCFSFRLMLYPPAAIDYVVVHELCHILHHDHSAAFYTCVEGVLPDYREREKLLR